MESEIKNLTLLGQRFKRFVALLNIGGVIDCKQLDTIQGIGAVLYISQCGNQIGNICSLSGKLSTTWAKYYEDYPSAKEFSYVNGNWNDEYYKECIYVGYRYFDKFNITLRYCFGYGTGYSTFSIDNVHVEADHKSITVKATVKNTGSKYNGKEAVQVYVSPPKGHLHKPFQVLVGFGKSRSYRSMSITLLCLIL